MLHTYVCMYICMYVCIYIYILTYIPYKGFRGWHFCGESLLHTLVVKLTLLVHYNKFCMYLCIAVRYTLAGTPYGLVWNCKVHKKSFTPHMVHTYVHTYMYVSTYTHMHMHVPMCARAHTHTHTHTHTHIHTHMHVPTCVHTHTQTQTHGER